MPKQNQHYVPEVYLKNFTFKDDKINVYDIEKKNHYKPNIKNIASEKEFYTPDLEELFGVCETQFNCFLNYIKQHNKLPPKTSAEFIDFIYFLTIQRIRHRFFKDAIAQQMNYLVKQLALMQYHEDDKNGKIPDVVKKIGIDKVIDMIEINKDGLDKEFKNALGNIMPDIEEHVKMLILRNWELVSTKHYFITSDNPVCIVRMKDTVHANSSYGIAIATDETRLIYPISSTYCIIGYLELAKTCYMSKFYNKDIMSITSQSHLHPIRQALENETEEINDIIANHAHRYIYSSKEIPEKYKKREYENPLKIN